MNNNQFNSTLNTIDKEVSRRSKFVQQDSKTSIKGLSIFPLLKKFIDKVELSTDELLIKQYVESQNFSAKELKQNGLTSPEKIAKKIKTINTKTKSNTNKILFEIAEYIEVKHKLLQKVSLSPVEILSLININRQAQGLEKIEKDVHLPPLSSWVIDKHTNCDLSKLDNSTILSDTKNLIKKIYKYDVSLDNKTEITSLKNNTLIFGNKNLKDSTLTSAKLLLKAVENSTKHNLSKEIANPQLPNQQTALNVWKKLPESTKAQLQEDYENIINLFCVLTICATTMPTENYKQVAKVIDFEIGQSLFTFSFNFNCDAVGYLIAKTTIEEQKQLLDKLGYTQKQLLEKLEKVGYSYEDEEQINSLIECLTKVNAIELDRNHVSTGYKVDFAKIVNTDPYKLIIEKFKVELSKQSNLTDEQAETKENLTTKAKNLAKNLSSLKQKLESTESIKANQLKNLVETHAYCTVALDFVNDFLNTQSIKKKTKKAKKTNLTEQSTKVENSNVDTTFDYSWALNYAGVINQNIEQTVKSHVEYVETKVEPPVATPTEVAEKPEVIDVPVVEVEQTFAPSENINLEQEIATNNAPIEETTATIKKPYVAPKVEQVIVEQPKPKKAYTKPQLKTFVQKQDVKQGIVSEEVKPNSTAKTPNLSTPKPEQQVNKETEMNNLQQEIELLKKSNQALLDKVEQLSKTQLSSQDLQAQKLERLTQKFQEIIKNNIVKSISSLANKNLEEIGNKLVYSTSQYSRDCATLLAGLNLLMSMQDGDKTVRNMFVALNRPELVRSLMLLKEKLNTSFACNFASLLAQNSLEFDENNMSYEQMIHDAMVKMNNRFTYMLKDQCQTEIDMVRMMYEPDSFAYQDEVDSIKAKYYGDDEHYGLMQQLDKCLLGTTIKDIIFTEIKRIDNCDIAKRKYELNDKIVSQRIDEMFMNFSQDEEHFTF